MNPATQARAALTDSGQPAKARVQVAEPADSRCCHDFQAQAVHGVRSPGRTDPAAAHR